MILFQISSNNKIGENGISKLTDGFKLTTNLLQLNLNIK
jgi:hypothetical protein